MFLFSWSGLGIPRLTKKEISWVEILDLRFNLIQDLTPLLTLHEEIQSWEIYVHRSPLKCSDVIELEKVLMDYSCPQYATATVTKDQYTNTDLGVTTPTQDLPMISRRQNQDSYTNTDFVNPGSCKTKDLTLHRY